MSVKLRFFKKVSFDKQIQLNDRKRKIAKAFTQEEVMTNPVTYKSVSEALKNIDRQLSN